MSAEGKAILESHLGRLLGFDDGASDILDHLLSIESKEDLLEYLLQLLGEATQEVTDFVDNVGRYQDDEPLKITGSEIEAEREDSKPKAQETLTKPTPTKKQPKYDAQQASKTRKQNKSRVPPPQRKDQASKQSEQTKQHEPNIPSQPTKPKERTVIKSRPPKGKPKIICGCFGSKHKPLTNCLYCGRISCVQEGYDFCGFCGYSVEAVRDGIHDGDEAWVRKERLLRFDREFARRTEIFDDQADFQGPETWMTEEEIEKAEEATSRRLEALKRPKQTLQIGII
mmetsp:Transcript_60485/g.91216  ORF Transcript_60485/g.91216 Transcript_60485/m.91216 type:complete len:284 (-) Transcript_60485:789-1640(-)